MERGQNPNAISLGAALFLAALLLCPGAALARLATIMDVRLVLGWLAFISLLTFVLYSSDKKKASAGEWRTPENTLHLAELLGGWPAAFVAQRRFRHKIAKGSYQFIFWGIVALHQFAAFDSLQGWQWSQKIVEAIQATPR